MLLATAALLGWAIDSAALKCVVPGLMSMKVNSAFALIALSIVAGVGFRRLGVAGTAVVWGCLALAGALSLATLAEHAFGVDLRIDNAVIVDAESPHFPGRNAPSTNIAVLGLTVAFGLFFARRATAVAQVVCCVIAIVPLTALGGYLYHAPGVDENTLDPRVALNTATGLLCLCLAGLFGRANEGLMGLVTAPTLAGSLARKLLPAAVIVPFLIELLVLIGERAGLYSAAFGAALLVTSCAFCFAAAVCLTVVLLSNSERERAAAERKRASTERRMSDGEQQLRIAIDTARLGTWQVDLVTGQIDVSDRYRTNLGLGPDEDVSKRDALLNRLDPEDRERVRAAVVNAVRDRHDYREEFRVRWPDGSVHWLVSSGRAMYDEADRPLRIVGVALDVTAERAAGLAREELFEIERKALAVSERANRLKDEFLATLSHELRTPLSAILGWSQLLRRAGTTPAAMDEGLITIERNARAQSQIIGDLLDMSSIISGKVRLDAQPLDLMTAFKSSVDTMRPTAMAKGVDLVFDAGDDSRCPIVGDIGRLQQVFWNVLSNAIKFTPRGGRVEARIARRDSMWQVEVRDTGEGIAPDFLPFVFDRFRQADASTTRRHGGLGLGLAIVNQLMELHGGKARAMSEGLGRGATFALSLPVRAVDDAEDSADAPANPSPDPKRALRNHVTPEPLVLPSAALRNRVILIIDDEPDARTLLQRLLTDSGATVLVATTADEALYHVAVDRPDMLVSDIAMPIVDGYELIRRVRKLPRDKGGATPAIALTAYVRDEDQAEAAKAGFQAHVAKPIEPTDLVDAIQRLLGPTS